MACSCPTPTPSAPSLSFLSWTLILVPDNSHFHRKSVALPDEMEIVPRGLCRGKEDGEGGSREVQEEVLAPKGEAGA